MPDLFELPELASYMQREDLDASTVTLNRELTTTMIRRTVGRVRWAAITVDQIADLKPIALDVAKRLTEEGERNRTVRQEAIDDYSVGYEPPSSGSKDLTQAEEEDVLAVFGQRGGAFSIAPSAPAPRPRGARFRRPRPATDRYPYGG